MNNTAIITGASKDMGWAITKMLAERGMHRIIVVGRHEAALKMLKEELAEHTPSCRFRIIPVNLANTQQLFELCAVIRDIRNCNLLINCADFFSTVTLENSNKQMRDVYEANFMASLHLSRAVLGSMKESGTGNIINIPGYAEQSTHSGLKHQRSKNPLWSFSDSLINELLDWNIKVTTIQLAYKDTLTPKYLNGINDHVINYANNVAKAVRFILNLSEDINIAHLRLDVVSGGESMADSLPT